MRSKKKRGSRTYGYGSKKKHRGGGSRGGRGCGGSHKHKYSYFMRFEPDHFGYKGFHSLKKKEKIINVGELEKFGKKKIDLASLGFTKLLSKGEVTKPLTIKIKKFSAKAKEKIEKAGGRII